MGSASAFAGACGICSSATSLPNEQDAVREAVHGLGSRRFQHVMALFSNHYDTKVLAAALAKALPGVPVSGCSTAGEIAPHGMINSGLVLIAFPFEGFRVHSGLIEDIDAAGVERASEVVRDLKSKLQHASGTSLADRVFGIMLVDGLSNSEEAVVAAVHWGFGDMQLVGGSAADALEFGHTAVLYEGRVLERAAVITVVESDFPFRIFRTQNFEPTPIKLVVTAADTANRIVHELNAEPAAREYAAAIGLLPDELGPFSFAAHPLVVKVGGDYFCRSIRNMNPDGSLSFFCAIDEGLVFTVARPRDILQSTQAVLAGVVRALGGIDMVIGFDCILRRLDAEARQSRMQMEDLYKQYRIVGFHTYGEQLNAMHLNQTLTGVAFGLRESGI